MELVGSWPTTSLETAPVFPFFFFFFSFVFSASSTSRVISPSGENQEAMRKLGTISSFISSKELEEEVAGRKDVKADRNLRDSWKYSREQGWGQGAKRNGTAGGTVQQVRMRPGGASHTWHTLHEEMMRMNTRG